MDSERLLTECVLLIECVLLTALLEARGGVAGIEGVLLRRRLVSFTICMASGGGGGGARECV